MGAFILGIIFAIGIHFWKKEQARDLLVKQLKYGNRNIIRRAAIEMNQIRETRRLQIIAADYHLISKLWEKEQDRVISSQLWTVLHRLQHLKNRKGCLCKIYPLDNFSNPESEDRKAEVRIVSRVKYDEDKNYWLCQCRSCEENYIVLDGFWGKWGWETYWIWKNISNEQFECISKKPLTLVEVTDIFGYGRIDEVIARHRSEV